MEILGLAKRYVQLSSKCLIWVIFRHGDAAPERPKLNLGAHLRRDKSYSNNQPGPLDWRQLRPCTKYCRPPLASADIGRLQSHAELTGNQPAFWCRWPTPLAKPPCLGSSDDAAHQAEVGDTGEGVGIKDHHAHGGGRRNVACIIHIEDRDRGKRGVGARAGIRPPRRSSSR